MTDETTRIVVDTEERWPVYVLRRGPGYVERCPRDVITVPVALVERYEAAFAEWDEVQEVLRSLVPDCVGGPVTKRLAHILCPCFTDGTKRPLASAFIDGLLHYDCDEHDIHVRTRR